MSEGEKEKEGELERLYTIREVARLLGLSYITVWQWIRKGKLKAVKLGTSPKAPVRIPESEVRRLLKEVKGAEKG
jgi:excisionase family DNA binding protein